MLNSFPMDLPTITRRAKGYAFRRNRGFDADDFASFCVLFALEKNNPDPAYYTLWVDFLRTYYIGRGQKRSFEPLVDDLHFAPDEADIDVEARDLNSKALAKVNAYERLLFRLKYKHELDLDQLSELMGLPKVRVSYLLKKIREKLRPSCSEVTPTNAL